MAHDDDRPLHILFAASECHPFEKYGSIADVTASLPKELAAAGHRVEIFLPLYLKSLLYAVDHGLPIQRQQEFCRVQIRQGHLLFRSRIYTTELPDAPVRVHLVDADTLEYFTSRSVLASPYEFAQNFIRFAFFCKVVATIAARRPDRPDLVHCHHWPMGLIPTFLSTQFQWSNIATLFTLHSLAYTETLEPDAFFRLTRLRDSRHPGIYDWKGRGLVHQGRIDLLKAGMVRADLVNTVSPTHAEEIRLPEHGGEYAGTLDWLAQQGRLSGVCNGLDAAWWPRLPVDELLRQRRERKAELQRTFELPEEPEAFVALMTSRLHREKGYPLLGEALEQLRQRDVPLQLIVVADGEEDVLARVQELDTDELPVRHRAYSEALCRELLYPTVDVLLLPSQVEPCSLAQMAAQVHGVPTVGRRTGGLADRLEEGITGFVFDPYRAADFAAAVERAYRLFSQQPAEWDALQRRIAGLDVSWRQPAARYVELYREAIRRARQPARWA